MKKLTPAEFGTVIGRLVKQAASLQAGTGHQLPKLPSIGMTKLPTADFNTSPALPHQRLPQTPNFPVGGTSMPAERGMLNTLRALPSQDLKNWTKFIHGDQLPGTDNTPYGRSVLSGNIRQADSQYASTTNTQAPPAAMAAERLLTQRLGGRGVGNIRWDADTPDLAARNAAGLTSSSKIMSRPYVEYENDPSAMSTINHELEHVRSDTNNQTILGNLAHQFRPGSDRAIAATAAVETPTGLGDLIFNGEVANQTWPGKSPAGRPHFQHTVNYPSGKSQDIQWMIQQAKRHGYFKGKPMADLIGSNVGQQYLRQAADPAHYPQPAADQPPLPNP